MTPSAAADPLRRLSRSSSAPRCTSAPAEASDAAAASERARPRTWCPAAESSRTMAEPMYPVAPVTKTLIGNSSIRLSIRHWVGVSVVWPPHACAGPESLARQYLSRQQAFRGPEYASIPCPCQVRVRFLQGAHILVNEAVARAGRG